VQIRDGQVTLGFHSFPNLPLADLVAHFLTRPVQSRLPPRLEAPRESVRAFEPDDQPMTPDDIAAGLNQAWPMDEPLLLSADVGDCLFTAMSIERAHLIAPGYYASMGFGVPAGLGLQVASNRRPVILVGDGAFQMTGWELGNCARYGWDPLVIVLNNACWEMLRAFQPESQFNLLNQWDFAGLAARLGGNGVRVQRRGEFLGALSSAINRRGQFQLIEVLLPRGSVSQTMSRYTAGLKSFRQSLLEFPDEPAGASR
jgi:indolepyruvate decarboxylase